MELPIPKKIATMHVPPKTKIASLRDLCLQFGVKKFGKNFIESFTWLSANKKAVPPKDLIDSTNEYYLSRWKAWHDEIDCILKKKYPRALHHAPPAPQINKLVIELYEKKRFDSLSVVNEEYYASLKWPAITSLAGEGYLAAIKILIAAGANVNARNFYARTPLICAAMNGHFEVVEYLIEGGADIDAIDMCNYNAIKHAAERKHKEVHDLLCAKKKEKEELKKRSQHPRINE